MTILQPGASNTGGNACRYCFNRLPWEDHNGKPVWYCGEGCRNADQRRPDKDARAEVLDGLRDEPAGEPDFEPVELWP